MIWLGFMIYLLSFLLQIELRDSKLIFLQYLFRHGDRAPVTTYPGDLTPEDFWPEGYGQLTKLGKKQHYELGKFIRHMYKDFITSDPKEVLLNSTDQLRCLQSGLSHIAALYAPTTEWMVADNLNWQPIPIHYTPYKKVRYLSSDIECPRADDEQLNMYKDPLFLQHFEKYKPMLEELSCYIGHTISPLEAIVLFDNLHVEKLYNRPLPDWTSFYYDELQELFELSLSHSNASSQILGKMVEDMKRKIAGEIPHLKVQVYSGQFSHVWLLLKTLGVFNNIAPYYCATVLLELHELSDGSNAVRLLYLNSTTPEHGFQVPHVLTMEGCVEYCPFDFLENYAKDLVPQDWEEECGLIN